MVRKFRKTIYASQSKRQALWERVIELCERKKEPTASEIKSVLPAPRYNAYVKSLRTWKRAGVVKARPREIEIFIEERRSIKNRERAYKKRTNTKMSSVRGIDDWTTLHEHFVEQCEEKPELYEWIKNLDEEGSNLSRSEFIGDQDIGVEISLYFHTVASYNKRFKDATIDTAERAAVADYFHSLQKEFQGEDDWHEVVKSWVGDIKVNRFRNKDFSGIKY